MEKDNDQSATKYVVNMTAMSNVCQVQLETASPIGARHLGPFDTRAQALKAMCDDVDVTTTDPTHCWLTIPANACNP